MIHDDHVSIISPPTTLPMIHWFSNGFIPMLGHGLPLIIIDDIYQWFNQCFTNGITNDFSNVWLVRVTMSSPMMFFAFPMVFSNAWWPMVYQSSSRPCHGYSMMPHLAAWQPHWALLAAARARCPAAPRRRSLDVRRPFTVGAGSGYSKPPNKDYKAT